MMHRSQLLPTLLAVALFGGLALIPTGCSNDESLSPNLAMPSSGDDGYPPATPSGLHVVRATDQGVKLGWSPNAESDFAGYRVHVYDPSPYRQNSYVCVNGASLVAENFFVFSTDAPPATQYFRVSALDQNGNESDYSLPFEYHPYDAPGGDADQQPREPEGGASTHIHDQDPGMTPPTDQDVHE